MKCYTNDSTLEESVTVAFDTLEKQKQKKVISTTFSNYVIFKRFLFWSYFHKSFLGESCCSWCEQQDWIRRRLYSTLTHLLPPLVYVPQFHSVTVRIKQWRVLTIHRWWKNDNCQRNKWPWKLNFEAAKNVRKIASGERLVVWVIHQEKICSCL